jgi:hypothetical protein
MLNELVARRWNANMILSVPFPSFALIPTEVGLVGIGVLLLALAFSLHRRRVAEEVRRAANRPVLVMQFNINLCAALQRRLMVVKRFGYRVPGRHAATIKRRRRLTDEARMRLRREGGFFPPQSDRWKGDDV